MSDDPFQQPKRQKEDLLKPPFDINNPYHQNNQSFSTQLGLSDSDSSQLISFRFGQRRPAIHGKQMLSFIDPSFSKKKVAIQFNNQYNLEQKFKVEETHAFNLPTDPRLEVSITSPIQRIRKSSFYEFVEFSASPEGHDSHQNLADLAQNYVDNESLHVDDIEEKTEGAITPKFRVDDLDDSKLIIEDFLGLEKKNTSSPSVRQSNRIQEFVSVSFGNKSEASRVTMQRKPVYVEFDEVKKEVQSEKKEVKRLPNQRPNLARNEPICYGCGGKHYFNCCPSRKDTTKSTEIKCFNCKKEGHNAKNCPEPRKCNNCGSINHLARDCPSDQTSRRYKICINCKQPGHFAKDCTKPKKCFLCHQVGHEIKDCPKNKKHKMSSSDAAVLKPTVCFNCRKEGHYADDCKDPERCYKCGKEGHFSRDCPHLIIRSRSVEVNLNEQEKSERNDSLEIPVSEPQANKISLITNLNFKKSRKSSMRKSSKDYKKSKNSNNVNQRLKQFRK